MYSHDCVCACVCSMCNVHCSSCGYAHIYMYVKNDLYACTCIYTHCSEGVHAIEYYPCTCTYTCTCMWPIQYVLHVATVSVYYSYVDDW